VWNDLFDGIAQAPCELGAELVQIRILLAWNIARKYDVVVKLVQKRVTPRVGHNCRWPFRWRALEAD
jgi:hypothetical protein